MTTITSQVAKIYENSVNTKFGEKTKWDYILSDGERYGSWKNLHIKEGDTVEFQFVSDGRYRNVKSHKIVSTGSTESSAVPVAASGVVHAFPVGTRSRERSICRQSSLKTAAELFSGGLNHATMESGSEEERINEAEVMGRVVLSVARQFEAYVTGDDDLEEVKRMMNAEDGNENSSV